MHAPPGPVGSNCPRCPMAAGSRSAPRWTTAPRATARLAPMTTASISSTAPRSSRRRGRAHAGPRHQGAGWPRDGYCVSSKALRRRRQSCARRRAAAQQGQPQAPGRGLRAGAAALRAGVSGPVPVPSTGPGHVDPGNRLDHAHAGATGQDPLGHLGMAGGRYRDAVRLRRTPQPERSSRSTACFTASASSTSTIRWSSGAGWG